MGFPGSSDGKESACNVEIQVLSLGLEDPLEKGMATHLLRDRDCLKPSWTWQDIKGQQAKTANIIQILVHCKLWTLTTL